MSNIQTHIGLPINQRIPSAPRISSSLELQNNLSKKSLSMALRDKVVSKVVALLSKKMDDIGIPIHFNVVDTDLFIYDILGTSEKEIRQEISRILENKNIQKIHFNQYLGKTKKRILANILSKNHPLIEVLRLIPGNDVINIGFTGIKQLNDIYGQNFVDTLLISTKEMIIQSVDEYIKTGGIYADHIRLVRNDYKNLTLSLPTDTDLIAMLFSDLSSKEMFLKQLIASMRPHIIDLAKEKGGTVLQIEKNIIKNWNFGVGKSLVPLDAKNEQKLHAFAEAELVSRDGIKGKNITTKVFNKNRSSHFAERSIQQETDIIGKWSEMEFIYEDISYPIMTRVDGKIGIHPELLRQIRKNGLHTLIEPKALVHDVDEYINTLNAGFDFIAPFHDLDIDLLRAQKMSDDFGLGIIESDSLLQNFKGAMTKENLIHMTDGKSGMRMFIDIKDMGIHNIQSFQHLSRRIASGDDVHPENLLLGGKEVTDSFILFIDTMKSSGLDVQISLGGDEVYIFFPGVSEKQSNKLLQVVHEKLRISQLEGRISYSFEVQAGDLVYKKLDESTVLHKKIETMFRQKRTLLNLDSEAQHETISLEIGKNKTESDVQMLFQNPLLLEKIDFLLQGIVEGNQISSGFIPIPNSEGMLFFQYNNNIIHFEFT